MGEGGGGTDEMRGGGGRKIEGEGGRDGNGERHARRVWRNLLTKRGVAAIAIAVAATATEEELTDSPTCGGKRREGSRRCRGEGEEDLRETSGNSDREGTRGGDAGIENVFPLTC
jgi:hypothetical protein